MSSHAALPDRFLRRCMSLFLSFDFVTDDDDDLQLHYNFNLFSFTPKVDGSTSLLMFPMFYVFAVVFAVVIVNYLSIEGL